MYEFQNFARIFHLIIKLHSLEIEEGILITKFIKTSLKLVT
jgi:hypothetical protein